MTRHIITLIAIFCAVTALFAEGITVNIPREELLLAPGVTEPVTALEKGKEYNTGVAAYSLETLDSLFVEVCLPPGSYAAVYVDVSAGTLGYIPPESPLDSTMQYWIDNAPEGLRRQLRVNLAGLDSEFCVIYDDMLNDADPLWRDELLYCLGHLAREILMQIEMSYLLEENVRELYKRDSLLSYVEIADEGTPGSGDHRTVARYVTIDTGMTVYDTVTLTAEMYYKYVMFPKITDEIPRYIEPLTGDPVDPWSGKFWRTWFWDVAETTGTFECWALGDSLMLVDAVWCGLHGSPGENGAVGVVTQWIRNCLEFDSDSERPHQPVRIYAKHKGRCGEHEDITAAAARVGLIPVRGIEAISTDHVWNEFWTGWRWAGWEPVNNYIDNQWVYADGWGKEFATVYEHTGKGEMVPVTERYSHEIASVNLTVTDATARPVDGAEVLVAADYSTSIVYDCILFTNSRGKTATMVGDNKHLYWRVDSEVGSDPGPGYVDNLVTLTMDGSNYNRSKNVPGTIPQLNWVEDTSTASPAAYLGSRLRPIGEFIGYQAPFDDIEATYQKWIDDAYGFALFALDDEEFARFEAGSSFAVLTMDEACDTGAFEIPVEDVNYWVVVSNKENLKNTLVGGLAVMLHDSSTSVDEVVLPKNLSIRTYPNPFNSAVCIAIDAPEGAYCNTPPRMEIFDVAGRMIQPLTEPVEVRGGAHGNPSSPLRLRQVQGIVSSGNVFVWRPDDNIGSGVYLVRAVFGEDAVSKRLVYIK